MDGVRREESDRRCSPGLECASEHAGRVHGKYRHAVVGHSDDSTISAKCAHFAVDRLVSRFLKGNPGVEHAGVDVVGHGCANEILTPPGGRNGAGPVVRPGAGADDWAVSDSAVALVGHAAGGCAGSQVSIAVEGHTSDCAELLPDGVAF